MISSSSDHFSSCQDVEMDTGMIADVEDISSSDTETLCVRSRLKSLPPPPSTASLSTLSSTTTASIRFSFLVSGYERVAPAPQSQLLRFEHLEMAWMQKLTPVENQIAVQINRRRGLSPLVIDVRDFESLTEKEREDVRRRYAVDGGFAVVYTRSSKDREVAMKSLMKEGLFFGVP